MKVSVIMNCHNGMAFLKVALDSALNQSFKDFEIIFFDNCSTDDTATIVFGYDDSRLKYFRSDKFLSLGEARNEAISLSEGDFLAFLDADDIWHPNKLGLQLAAFTEGVGLVYSATKIFTEQKTTKRVSYNSPSGYVFRELLADYFLVMSSVVVSRQALNSLSHTFDPRFEIIEEYDLFLRLAVNWKVIGVRSFLCQWRWHQTSTTFQKSSLISIEKRILLRKLINDYPNLCEANIDSVNKVRGKIMITSALILYRKNRSARARALLRKSSIISKKGLFVYLVTFFPPNIVDKIYRLVKGNPLI